MSRIAIIGGHGRVALRLAHLLSESGHDVTSIIRSARQRKDVAETGAAPVVADVERLGPDALAKTLAGHDAVVWAAGAGGGSPERTYAVDRDAAIRSMDAALAAGIPRYVMVSYKGARLQHGVPPEDSFFAYAEAKAAADEHLRVSTLAWTILGPSALTDDPGTGQIEVGAHLESTSVPRDDVAAVAAAVLDLPGTIGRFIEFNSGSIPIPRALESYTQPPPTL
ncbi:Putative NADH-flavin reductase [Sanguibacter gelidistatuariae]|uniref:Putative NADH-flavin reductase n=1 Tax=Sanguibacter gelidistatuariae TaxID=1814289 RepID=A0A1G6HSD7_9MICO|nr:SDR family oxidoreductase [Sanguibacter gelidistatuariae]SDB96775.1 Putative NADH-flavin reductase [Sanguibacter gelidistatuariae]